MISHNTSQSIHNAKYLTYWIACPLACIRKTIMLFIYAFNYGVYFGVFLLEFYYYNSIFRDSLTMGAFNLHCQTDLTNILKARMMVSKK